MTHSTNVRRLAVATVAMALCAVVSQAQERGRSGRGFGGRGSLLGLLGMEQVQKEMKLTEEQTAKVDQMIGKLREEMRDAYGKLREIEDRGEQREKMSALADEFDGKVREQLRDVVERDQMMRLYQIRMQVRPVLESLANRYVAGRLELTDDQKAKLEKIGEDMQAKQSELFAKMRAASDEQRSEVFRKMRDLRSAADDQALEILTEDQEKAFEEMKGEKFELEFRRGRREAA